MNGAGWARARAIFEAALELPEAEREPYARKECGDDAPLLAEVLSLLAHDRDAPDDFVVPPPAPVSEEPRPGLRLGAFVLERELGRGAMGVVHLAREPSLDRTVAVKVLATGPFTTPATLERFHREARSAARLDHPQIVKVLADGTTGAMHWFAMEYVEGRSLEQELDALRAEPFGSLLAETYLPRVGAPDHIQVVATLVADVAGALAHAHERGVVHRDVKPSNILLSARRAVKLVDFGIARDESFGTLTRSDQLVGSAPYMSPEQAHLIEVSVDHRTDVYSLGVVLYELLTLRRPFSGATSFEVLSRLRTQEARPVTQFNERVPRDLAVICAHAMSKKPDERYATAAEFEADLRRFLRHEAIQARPPSGWALCRRFVRRRRGPLLAGVVAVAALVLGVSAAGYLDRARKLRADVGTLQALVARDVWTELTDDELSAARAALERLRGRAEAPLVDDAQRRLDDLRAAWLAEATELEARGRLATASGLDDGAGHADILRASQLEQRLEQHFPGLQSGLDSASFAPAISVHALDVAGAPCTGRVAYRLLDPATALPGPSVALGPLPLTSARAPIGNVRFEVSVDGYGWRELTRLLAPGSHVDLDVGVRAEQQSTDGMVLIPAGRCAHPAHPISPLHGLTIDVEAYWLDECEVSIRDYRRYLAAHPEVAVPWWLEQVPAGSDLELRPMVRVTWEEARAYAEWLGKRLPTHAEWMLAARGPSEGRLWPWGSEPGLGNTGGAKISAANEDALLELFFAGSAPVRSFDAARTPEGVYHLFGNVTEWTESHTSEQSGGRFLPHYKERILVGSAWDAGARGHDLTIIETGGTGAQYRFVSRGFRCARGVAP